VGACRENNPAYSEDIREHEAVHEVVPTQTCTTAGESTTPNGRHGGRPLQENAGPAQIAIPKALQPPIHWLRDECRAGDWPALQAAHYIAVQKAAVGMIPTQQQVLFERFFDESGGMQLVIHAPFGARINRAWGLALRKRFCRTFDFELQASADDNGIVLSVGPQNSFPIEAMFKMLGRHNGRELLVQALLAVPMFQVRWRWNTTRALMVLRQRGGRKVPPPLQRFRADDLLTAVFPQQTQCFEHRTGDLEVPDHPLARQTVHDCLHEAMDLDRWLEVLDAIDTGAIQLIGKDTREPSPFSYELLNAYPYAFLDDAPLEERRARAVATRRTLNIEDMRDLGRLDPAAIARVRADAWPVVRDVDELHDALLSMAVLPALEGAQWTGFLRDLIAHGRAVELRLPGGSVLWLAAERWPLVRAAYPQAEVEPLPALPPALLVEHSASEAAVAIIRGRLESTGPQTAVGLAQALSLPPAAVEGALETLESQGLVLRGRFTPEPSEARSDCVEWCDRRLLARIHRLTLDSLRQRIQPVEPREFWRFLIEYQRAAVSTQLAGAAGALQVIRQLEGFELPAGAWEHAILPTRLKNYDPAWLDQLSHSGQVAWGRLQPPRQAEDVAPGGSIMTRVVPISLLAREDLGWLLPPEREDARRLARSSALAVLDALGSYGAMFIHDLPAATGLLPTQVEDALSELSALGLVTADGFAAIRALVSPNRRQVERTRRQLRRRLARPRLASRGGRWSRFPGWTDAVSPEQRVERWARLLLDRYGVIFRDLLANETVAPAWRELAPLYRRMEARGEIRGGRFVSGVAGEQFALPYAVEVLRRIRDTTPTDDWLALSAADPLNLTGILLPGPRIPATRSNAILLRDGRLVAGRLGRQPVFYEDADLSSQDRMTRMLRTVGVHTPVTPVTKDPPVFTA
jgi:ATP-dependent Lhr-like helicase